MRLRDSRPRAAFPRRPLVALLIKRGLTRPGRDISTVENCASFFPSLTKHGSFRSGRDYLLGHCKSVAPGPLPPEMKTSDPQSVLTGRMLRAVNLSTHRVT